MQGNFSIESWFTTGDVQLLKYPKKESFPMNGGGLLINVSSIPVIEKPEQLTVSLFHIPET
jgi:hypothetical protein